MSDFDKTQKELAIIRSTLIKIDKTLYANTKSLNEHMRRTELLEEEAKSFKAHMEQMKGASKLLGLLALIATILAVMK